MAETEPRTAARFDAVHQRTNLALLVPMALPASLRQRREAIPPAQCTPQWAGYATTKQPYTPVTSQRGPFSQRMQRLGERPDDWQCKACLATADGDEAAAVSRDYPKRWHIEEFFNAHQA